MSQHGHSTAAHFYLGENGQPEQARPCDLQPSSNSLGELRVKSFVQDAMSCWSDCLSGREVLHIRVATQRKTLSDIQQLPFHCSLPVFAATCWAVPTTPRASYAM